MRMAESSQMSINNPIYMRDLDDEAGDVPDAFDFEADKVSKHDV